MSRRWRRWRCESAHPPGGLQRIHCGQNPLQMSLRLWSNEALQRRQPIAVRRDARQPQSGKGVELQTRCGWCGLQQSGSVWVREVCVWSDQPRGSVWEILRDRRLLLPLRWGAFVWRWGWGTITISLLKSVFSDISPYVVSLLVCFSSQVEVHACRASACAQMAGQVRAAVVPSPRQPASQPTACFVAAVAGARVGGARVTTLSTPGISARSAQRAKAPASHTGTASLHNRKAWWDCLQAKNNAPPPPSLFFRKCVDCHLSHGLAPKEAGLCNSTCVPLVGYVDGTSGSETISRSFTQMMLTFKKKMRKHFGWNVCSVFSVYIFIFPTSWIRSIQTGFIFTSFIFPSYISNKLKSFRWCSWTHIFGAYSLFLGWLAAHIKCHT